MHAFAKGDEQREILERGRWYPMRLSIYGESEAVMYNGAKMTAAVLRCKLELRGRPWPDYASTREYLHSCPWNTPEEANCNQYVGTDAWTVKTLMSDGWRTGGVEGSGNAFSIRIALGHQHRLQAFILTGPVLSEADL